MLDYPHMYSKRYRAVQCEFKCVLLKVPYVYLFNMFVNQGTLYCNHTLIFESVWIYVLGNKLVPGGTAER